MAKSRESERKPGEIKPQPSPKSVTERIKKRFKAGKPAGSTERDSSIGFSAIEGGVELLVLDLVVGECDDKCENDTCEWHEVPHHYLTSAEKVCFELHSMQSGDGSVQERRVIVRKPIQPRNIS
jgi:hypothetical protein